MHTESEWPRVIVDAYMPTWCRTRSIVVVPQLGSTIDTKAAIPLPSGNPTFNDYVSTEWEDEDVSFTYNLPGHLMSMTG